MPLRYLQLPGQDLDHDLVSLGGLYNGNSVGKGAIDGLDFDWNNWMQWDAQMTPAEAPEDIITGSRYSPDTYFSDLESPMADGISPSFFSRKELATEDAPFNMDNEIESIVFSPTTSSMLDECIFDSNTAVRIPTQTEESGQPGLHSADHVCPETKTNTTSKPTRTKISRPLQIDASPRRGRKRKVGQTEADSSCLSKKRGHNAIEKRYRTNLNEKINCLRQAIPSCSGTKAEEDDSDDDENKNGQQKVGKAAVLTRALEYIKHLESNTLRLGREIDALKSRVGAFERLAQSGIATEETDIATTTTPSCMTLQMIQEGFKTAERPRLGSTPASDAAIPSKKLTRQNKLC